jgi:hypothetical protein
VLRSRLSDRDKWPRWPVTSGRSVPVANMGVVYASGVRQCNRATVPGLGGGPPVPQHQAHAAFPRSAGREITGACLARPRRKIVGLEELRSTEKRVLFLCFAR